MIWKDKIRLEREQKIVMGCSVATHERRSLSEFFLSKRLIFNFLEKECKIKVGNGAEFRQKYRGTVGFRFSIRERNKYLKKRLTTKHCRQLPATPTQRLDCGELRQCDRLQPFFTYK
jgi:hypothetical protein